MSADELDDDMGTPPANTPEACSVANDETALESELGSVGFMKNIAEHPESIRALAKRLLNSAMESSAFTESPTCQDGCASGLKANIVYRVEPTVFVPEAEQQAMCLDLEKTTMVKPLEFPAKEFASLDKLNEWVMEFSQGRGDEGKALYAQCGGNCSPRYTFFIQQHENEKLSISADVLCGLARDKKSDQYLVSTGVRWQCANP